MAKTDSGEEDESVLAAFMSYHGGYNADWAVPGVAVPDFDEEGAAFFRNELRHRYEPLVSRLLEERLAEPND